MTTQTAQLGQETRATSRISGIASIITVAMIGLGVVFFTGHLQAGTLHDGAHDVRHATGFPSH
ncbi:MAG: CbtB domain-containing protein [Pseudomonadota bacterium]|nr:CbtB domain-containing protein [Pseudomonadota bacterium]